MALRQFGLWLLDSDRCGRNPFHRLHGVATPADTKRERLALTAEQVQLLVAAAEERPVAEYRKNHPQALPETLQRLARNGRHRGLLYLFAALTGLRRAECAGIRWADLQLVGETSVTARAVTTKAKRREPLPLDQILARELLAWRKAVAQERGGRVPPATEAVFAVPKNLTVQLRKDAKHAEIPLEDDHGRKLDFHALRATFATLLAKAGVPLQVGRGLIRHTDPKLTAKHYEKLALSDLRVGSLQVSSAFWNEPSVAPVAANKMRDAAPTGEGLRTQAQERKDGTG
jgi:integrase